MINGHFPTKYRLSVFREVHGYRPTIIYFHPFIHFLPVLAKFPDTPKLLFLKKKATCVSKPLTELPNLPAGTLNTVNHNDYI